MTQTLLDSLWARAAETWDNADMLILADALLDVDEYDLALGVRHAVEYGKRCQFWELDIRRYWWDGASYETNADDSWRLEPFMATVMNRLYRASSLAFSHCEVEERSFQFLTKLEALQAYAACYAEWKKKEGMK